ncbi:MAG: NAD-dependent epimerase/dehydratase family protein, partial [Candidatus Pacebacteria bacterium]|nr:NAD-dependent epimerase/dehydratase family protein [Candidatus Paceibacterota bacterium]
MTDSQPTILITGGTGFAGSHLVDHLVAQGKQRIHVTTYGSNTSYAHQLLPSDQIHQLDLTDQAATAQILAKIKPDQIYHLAALAKVGSSYEVIKKIIENNFTLQLSLFDGVRQHCPQARILVVGSALEYQPQNRPLKETDPLGPVNPYGVSKVLQDVLGYAYARSYQLRIIRCRPFNHIGERQAPGFAIPDFSLQIAQIENNSHLEPVIQVGNLDAIRDFTDVKDVVKAYSLLMSHGQVGQAYNIGSGQGYTIKHMLNQLLALSQRKISIETD